MTTQDLAFAGSIPKFYDQGLGPVIFEPAAIALVERVPHLASGAVLEVACGTGRVTRHLRQAFPPEVRLVATDLSESMLSYARAKDIEGVEWSTADALSLPFDDASFDLVICQFGIMFFPDRQAGLKEFRRVLKPGGTAVVAVWDTIESMSVMRHNVETSNEYFTVDPPVFVVPFSMADPTETRALFESVFGDVSLDRFEFDVPIQDPELAARGCIQGNPFINELMERDPAAPKVLIERLTAKLVADPISHGVGWFVKARE